MQVDISSKNILAPKLGHGRAAPKTGRNFFHRPRARVLKSGFFLPRDRTEHGVLWQGRASAGTAAHAQLAKNRATILVR
jgi:hypothetical protein